MAELLLREVLVKDFKRFMVLEERPAAQLQRQREFQDYLKSKYPDRKPSDLSVHQMKRASAGFRQQVRERKSECASVFRY